eukprot:TRINITY_DN17722_c0_g1_i1.p1 TRINITY_DN17722_c0_g1~~TRINITY_DN17722_c0_g1_i1.p1  ORF type:complete len:437 (+),score=156.23 TRINITY_DN17722_c0_g1_i1:130-1440(+)
MSSSPRSSAGDEATLAFAMRYFGDRVAHQQQRRSEMDKAKERERRKAERAAAKERKRKAPRLYTPASGGLSPAASPTNRGASSSTHRNFNMPPPGSPSDSPSQTPAGTRPSSPATVAVRDSPAGAHSPLDMALEETGTADGSSMPGTAGTESLEFSMAGSMAGSLRPPLRNFDPKERKRRATQRQVAKLRKQLILERAEAEKRDREKWVRSVEKARRVYRKYDRLCKENDVYFLRSLKPERRDELAKLQDSVYMKESTARYVVVLEETDALEVIRTEFVEASRAVNLQVVKNRLEQIERIDQSQFKHGLQTTIESQIRRIAEAKNFEFLKKEARRREKERGQGLPLPVMTRVQEKTVMRCLLALEKRRELKESEFALEELRAALHSQLVTQESEHLQRSIATRERNARAHRVRGDVAKTREARAASPGCAPPPHER